MEITDGPGRPSDPAADRAPATSPSVPVRDPVPPEQSSEDTDAAWGEYRRDDDGDRLYRDRPPHWDDF